MPPNLTYTIIMFPWQHSPVQRRHLATFQNASATVANSSRMFSCCLSVLWTRTHRNMLRSFPGQGKLGTKIQSLETSSEGRPGEVNPFEMGLTLVSEWTQRLAGIKWNSNFNEFSATCQCCTSIECDSRTSFAQRI